jgi:hypothetical protein
MAATSFKIRGIAPPDLGRYSAAVRTMFWSWVLDAAIPAKVKELKAGLDKDGEPMKAISAKTRKYRRSAMTPGGKGDPAAPPLIPGWMKSRTISLLAGRALSTHADFFWRFDPFTADSWGKVLSYQARKGRDVIGISAKAVKTIQAQAWAKWAQFKAGKLPQQKAVGPGKAPGIPRVGSTGMEHATFGIGVTGPEKFAKGQWTGGMTWPEWQKYFRETAKAKIPGRPNPMRSPHPEVGKNYNRLLGHIWSSGQRPAGPPTAKPIPVTPPVPKVPPKTQVAMPPAPKPAPKPAPPPPKPVGPAGTPVRDALVNTARGKTKDHIDAVLGLIAKVHGDGSLTKIPIKQTTGTRRMGAYVWNISRPVEIRISSQGDHPRMTTAHEIGHFIEDRGIPKSQAGARIFSLSPELKDWLDAVTASKAYAELKALRAGGRSVKVAKPDGTSTEYILDKRYIGYTLQNDELWARSYAQYIATKSGDPVMLKELENGLKELNPYVHRQWQPDDFKPILEAIDAMFRKLGWIA